MPPGSASSPPLASASPPADEPVERFDASVVKLVLDDPKLADARAALASGKPLDAAKAVARAELPGEPELRAKWAYLEGRLRRTGGDPRGAALAFGRAAEIAGPLRPFALLAAAETLEALGDHVGAAASAGSIGSGDVPRARLDLVVARSLVRSGKLAEGLERFRALVAARPRGWPKLALELAKTLLAHPGEGRALEAARLGAAVDLDAPQGRGAEDGKKIEAEARATLSSDDRTSLDASADLLPVSRAKRLAASGQGKRALAVLDRLSKKGSLDCEGMLARADALGQVKRHSEASAEYGRAIEACEHAPGEHDGAAILYAAGRAAARGGQLEVAIQRYKRLEDAFHSHRLADDARLEGARAALENGDDASFERMLLAMGDDYPNGDMRGDGLFALGIARAASGNWARALAAFEKGAAGPAEKAYERAGRFTYFLGRALVATGRTEEGKAAFVRTIREVPCSLYMALAYARLEALESGAGRRALDEARAVPRRAPTELPMAVAKSDAWKAAVALVEVDAPDEAMSALALLGVGDRTAAPETLWAAARLLGRATDPVPAHSVLRSAFEIEPRPGKSEVYAFRASYPDGDWRLAWELAYPRPFAPLVARAASEGGVPEALVYAVMREESAFDPDALSKASAVGLLQLMPGTAKKLAGALHIDASPAKLHDPETNLRLGARYLSQLRAHFADDPFLAVPGYNAGRGAPEAWTASEPSRDFDLFVESIPYAETRAYTKRVLASLCAYEILAGDPDKSEVLRIPERVRSGP